MTSITPSGLSPAALPLAGNEAIPADQSGITGRLTPDAIAARAFVLGALQSGLLFSGLASATIPATTKTLATTGWQSQGVGAAIYTNVTGASLPSWGQGVWWQTTANGQTLALSADEPVTPAKFGAFCNGVSNDVPAINNAILYNETVKGTGPLYLEGRSYFCSSGKITLNPLRTRVVGDAAVMNWSAKTTTNPATEPQLNPDPNFSSASGWAPGPLAQGADPWTISGGVLAHTVTTSGSQYNDISKRFVEVQPGQVYTFTFTVESVSAAADQNYVEFRVVSGYDSDPTSSTYGTYPGYGYGDGLSYAINGPISTPTTYTVTYTTPADVSPLGAWVGFQSNNNVQITSLSIQAAPDNTCILMRVNAGDSQYGHETYGIEGVTLTGPGQSSYANAIQFDTLVNELSTRGQYRDLVINNFGTGFLFGNRVYAADFYGVSIYICGTCVASQTGTADAGEALCFYGAKLFNSFLAVSNPGGFEMHFFGGSFDYCSQYYVGAEGFKSFGIHYEKTAPSAATQYPFVLTSAGDWYATDCRFLGANFGTTNQVGGGSNGTTTFSSNLTDAGYVGQTLKFSSGANNGASAVITAIDGSGNITVASAFAHAPANGDTFFVPSPVQSWFYGADKFSRFILKDPGLYGYEGASGALMTGQGRMLIQGRVDWGQNHNIALIPKNDTNHNLFGAAGSFENVSPSFSTGNIGVKGWLDLGTATSRSGNTITFGSLGSATLGVVSGYPTHSGAQCLSLQKTGVGHGTGVGAWLAAPIKPGAQGVISLWYAMEPIAGSPTGNTLSAAVSAGATSITTAQSLASASGVNIVLDGGQSNQEAVVSTGASTGSGPYVTPISATSAAHASGAVAAVGLEIYIVAFFINILGNDATGTPIYSPDQVFFGEINVIYDPAFGQTSFQQAVFQTLYADESSPGDGLAPSWATHMAINISAINAPSGFNMLIDDLAGWQWGG